MVDTNPDKSTKKNKRDLFNSFLEIFGFIRIVASPFLAGLAIGLGVYVSKPDNAGLYIAISIAAIGLIIGIIWAAKISKNKSTLDYTTTAASPDFDKFNKDEE